MRALSLLFGVLVAVYGVFMTVKHLTDEGGHWWGVVIGIGLVMLGAFLARRGTRREQQ